jgi:hypothetical protein
MALPWCRALAVRPDRDDGFDDSSVALRAKFDSLVLPPKPKQQTGDRELSVQFDGMRFVWNVAQSLDVSEFNVVK